MKKVYLVSTGDYSDYHVVAAFSKREKAEKFLELGMYGKVEELVLDKLGDMMSRGYRWYDVDMKKDGTVEKVELGYNNGLDGNDWWEVWGDSVKAAVLAKSEKHAIKIVNEKRIMGIALGSPEEVNSL